MLSARHEPQESADPRNVMLALFEQQVRALIDCDCTHQVRAIIARLIPDAVPGAAPAPTTASHAAPPAAPVLLDEFQLVATLAALRRVPATPNNIASRLHITSQLRQLKARKTPQ